MSNRDNAADLRQEMSDLLRRVRDLETASPLSNASISTGGIRLLVPGENGSGPAKFGHDEATGKWGFLVKDGADYLTVQEMAAKKDTAERILMEQKIAASHEYPNNRIGDLEGRMGSAEAGVNYTANRVGDLEGRMGSAEAGINYTANRTTGLEGRMSNAESSLAGKASNSALNANIGRLEGYIETLAQFNNTVAQAFTAIRATYNAHIDSVHGGNGPKMTG